MKSSTALFALIIAMMLPAQGSGQEKPDQTVQATYPSSADSTLREDSVNGKSEIGLQLTGIFPKDTSGRTILESGPNSAGFLGTYRYHFNHWHGVEVNYGFTRGSFNFRSPFAAAGIQTNIHELTAAYVLSTPQFKKIRPFVLAGTGALFFDPSDESKVAVPFSDSQAKPVFLYGGGVDFAFTRALALRVGYRGLVFSAPDFKVRAFDTGATMHLAEPTAGFVIRF